MSYTFSVTGLLANIRKHSTAIFVGLLFIAGNISNAVYPIFVNALNHAVNIDLISIGSLATSEFFAFGFAVLFAGKIFPENNLRTVAGCCLAIHILTAGLISIVPESLLMYCRILYGCASGILIWLVYAYVARTRHPGRLVAIYTTVLMIAGVMWSLISSVIVIPLLGYDSVFLFLTALSLLALIFLRYGPNDLEPLAVTHEGGNNAKKWLPISSLLILAGVGFWAAFMSIFWVYSEPLAQQYNGSISQHWLTISLVFQIMGAGVSALLVERISPWLVITIGLIVSAIQVFSIIMGVSEVGFVLWAAVYGFLGYFLVSFFLKSLSVVDPTNRSVVYFPAAQFLSGSMGPLLVSKMVSETDLISVLYVDLAAIVIAPLLFWVAMIIHFKAFTNRRALNC